ncbi:MAG: glucose-6-phosphate isomerase [Cycloclasticus sp. symbiont of Bathymodiolus heckerae]|nr:MAG: glucose-6-phosphate isomerase [Cycloclasticus sp. symbiont of Bathymodiolus heckerae]
MNSRNIKAWAALQAHAESLRDTHLKDLFQLDGNRFDELSVSTGRFLLDFSKQRVTGKTLSQLICLAEQQELRLWIEKLFTGEKVNDSEQRPALHTALRSPHDDPLQVNTQNVTEDVHCSLAKMERLVEQVQYGQWRGFDGSPIKSVVNIGVGGSNLGPLMVCDALSQYASSPLCRLDVNFVSSMDGSELEKLLPTLEPATTLFIISSKTFSTIDTLANANTAREWLLKASGEPIDAINRHHFIAVTGNPKAALKWGVAEDNQLLFWDWVGGRYSLWSVIGLPIALKIGMEGFRAMLKGAHAMDVHFRNTDFDKNLPVLLGLIGVWNVNFLNIHAHAILPYDGRLAQLPSFLEQLEMESNGKSINRDGKRLNYRTCPVLWGEVGSNAQHAFYQLLHQGTEPVMCDFITAAKRYESEGEELQKQHQLSLANCLAQSRLLALGDSAVASEQDASCYQHYDGNQPSTTIVMNELTPESLGGLIALYEHKVFVQSVIWEINPFDQWGVEQGKNVALSLLAELDALSDDGLDASTKGLISYVQQCCKENEPHEN